MTQYMKFVKPSYENFIEPSKRYADVVLPNTKDQEMLNNNAVNMLLHHIKHQLEKRNAARRLVREEAGSPEPPKRTARATRWQSCAQR